MTPNVAVAPAPNRRQSARQARTSSTRPQNYYARPFAGRGSIHGVDHGNAANSGLGFFPAVSQFTDTITVVPKEIVRHFSMLKEVESKAIEPDDELAALHRTIMELPCTRNQRPPPSLNAFPLPVDDAPPNGPGNGAGQPALRPQEQQAHEQPERNRMEVCSSLQAQIANLLTTLDEKNALLTSANQVIGRELARMDELWPHIESEVSEEARWGSLTHWAYADKEEKKKGERSERTRRDVANANNLAAAAAAAHENEIAATRNEARRETVAAGRRNRNHHHHNHPHHDSDLEDRVVFTKKAGGHRGRKPAEAGAAADNKAYGLGISNGANPPSKRRKTEKGTAAAPAPERSVSAALNSPALTARGHAASPRETPVAETGKKRARAAPAQPTKKRNQPANGQTPPLASSPVVGTFTATKEVAGALQRPQSSRARQNSTANSVHSVTENGRHRPSSSSSNRPLNGATSITQELEQAAGIHRPPPLKEVPDAPVEQPAEDLASLANGPIEQTLKREDVEMQDEPEIPVPVVTRVGRASKTSTPTAANFPDIPMARSRSTRNNGGSHASSESNHAATATTAQKRAQKKGAATQQPRPPTDVIDREPEDAASVAGEVSGMEIEEEVEDVDELRYCYCNQVSYGGMIACDNENCKREWFHLDCVGMSKVPSSKTKWYCDDCKDVMKKGRPSSRQ